MTKRTQMPHPGARVFHHAPTHCMTTCQTRMRILLPMPLFRGVLVRQQVWPTEWNCKQGNLGVWSNYGTRLLVHLRWLSTDTSQGNGYRSGWQKLQATTWILLWANIMGHAKHLQEALLLREDEGSAMWSFDKIIDHRYKHNNLIKVQVVWDNGELLGATICATKGQSSNTCQVCWWTWSDKPERVAMEPQDHKKPKKTLHMLKLTKGQIQGSKDNRKFMFWIEGPRSVAHALEIDWLKGNSFWADTMKAEIVVPDKGASVGPEYTQVHMHIHRQ